MPVIFYCPQAWASRNKKDEVGNGGDPAVIGSGYHNFRSTRGTIGGAGRVGGGSAVLSPGRVKGGSVALPFPVAMPKALTLQELRNMQQSGKALTSEEMQLLKAQEETGRTAMYHCPVSNCLHNVTAACIPVSAVFL